MTRKLRPYWQALPDIFTYQIVTKPLIGVWIYLLGWITQILLRSTGRVAITSGDFTFLFKTWQGYLILLVGILSLLVYVAFDLNTKVVLGRKLVTGDGTTVWKAMNEGFLSIRGLLSLRGLIVAFYIALIAPLLGFGVSVTMTRGLYIPTFIASVIGDTPLYLVLVSFVVLLFLSVGVANLFILHGIVLDGLSAGEAGKQSGELLRGNWKDYVKQNALFILVMMAAVGIAALACLVLPLHVLYALPVAGGIRRFLTVALVLFGCAFSLLMDLFVTPLYLMKMTQLFYSYKEGEPREYPVKEKGKHPVLIGMAAAASALLILTSLWMNSSFDSLFPAESDLKIVAHRGGGSEGPENTLAGIDTAVAAGAWGTEVDIQRTKDGAYVLLHDGDFARVAGDERSPGEMTLKQIGELSVDGQPVPTAEETFAACRGRIVLFAELKGKSADRRMADDMVKLARRYHMEKECVLISLDYDLIRYIEETYPDISAGFLLFASFGSTDRLSCEYLGMEEESATANAIEGTHDQGKRILVWTPNEAKAQKRFMCSDADGMITDKVKQAAKIRNELKERTDLQRMIDRIMMIVG